MIERVTTDKSSGNPDWRKIAMAHGIDWDALDEYQKGEVTKGLEIAVARYRLGGYVTEEGKVTQPVPKNVRRRILKSFSDIYSRIEAIETSLKEIERAVKEMSPYEEGEINWALRRGRIFLDDHVRTEFDSSGNPTQRTLPPTSKMFTDARRALASIIAIFPYKHPVPVKRTPHTAFKHFINRVLDLYEKHHSVDYIQDSARASDGNVYHGESIDFALAVTMLIKDSVPWFAAPDSSQMPDAIGRIIKERIKAL